MISETVVLNNSSICHPNVLWYTSEHIWVTNCFHC